MTEPVATLVARLAAVAVIATWVEYPESTRVPRQEFLTWQVESRMTGIFAWFGVEVHRCHPKFLWSDVLAEIDAARIATEWWDWRDVGVATTTREDDPSIATASDGVHRRFVIEIDVVFVARLSWIVLWRREVNVGPLGRLR